MAINNFLDGFIESLTGSISKINAAHKILYRCCVPVDIGKRLGVEGIAAIGEQNCNKLALWVATNLRSSEPEQR